jgi:ABC-type molybdate transport system ATPase subunit
VLNGRVLNDVENVSAWRRKSAASAMFSGRAPVSALKCAAICVRHGEKHGGQFDKLVALLGIEPLLTACRAACPAEKNSGWRLAARC